MLKIACVFMYALGCVAAHFGLWGVGCGLSFMAGTVAAKVWP